MVATPSSIDRAIRRCYYGESTIASDTATPDSVGMDEALLSPEDLGATAQPPPPAPAAQADLARQVQELTERLAALEKHAANQVRALRGLFDLLVEKGQISREEYQARVRPRE